MMRSGERARGRPEWSRGGAIRRRFQLCVGFVLTLGLLFPWALESEKGTLSFVFENDLFYGTDRNYTNGVRAAWLSGPKEAPSLASRVARKFPLFPDGANLRMSYAVGQNMYVPSDITVANPPLGERPYAGWLYGSVGAVAESDHQLDQLQLTVGVLGPTSLARQTQEFVHNVTGSDAPKGWDTQLKNEPGVVLTYQRSWRKFESGSVLGFGFDFTPHAGAALGNVFTYANTGVTFRLGQNLTLDYGPPRIQPSLPGSGYFVPQDGIGWYLFAGVEGRAIARNIFLDGNSFQDSRSVDKNPLVGDFQFGFAVTFEDVRLSYTHVLRSPEFEGQSVRDNFGALSLSIRF
jgi:lipid A 3-O-deacylase